MRYTGKDVQITFGSFTAEFKSIEITVEAMSGSSPASDSAYDDKHFDHFNAGITLKGWEDGGTTGSGTFADVAALVLSRTAPSALSYTDTGGTPASMLPADFFSVHFPLAGWRVDKATGGSGGQSDASEWTAELSPRHQS